jgi:hypothetical protein
MAHVFNSMVVLFLFDQLLDSNASLTCLSSGSFIIDRWCLEYNQLSACVTDAGPGEGNASVPCISGRAYPLTLEYKHVQNSAAVTLSYGSPSIARTVIPSARLFNSPADIHGSPFSVVVFPNVADGRQSVVNGSTISLTTAGVLSVFTIRAKDEYANSKTLWDSTFTVFVSQGNQLKESHGVISANVEPGAYRVSYTITRAGSSSISIALAATGGIAATYYKSYSSSGYEQSDTLTRVESTMDISWNGSAINYLPNSSGTVRWQGLIRPTSTTPYTFITMQDLKNASFPVDRVQLWLDGQLLLDQWTSLDFAPASVAVSFPMAYEFYEVEMRYQSQAFSRLRLTAARAGGSLPTTIPSSNLFFSKVVADSPYAIQVVPAYSDLASSILAGSFLTVSTAGVLAQFSIFSRDRFGNQRNASGDTFLFHAVSSNTAEVLDSASEYIGNGIYRISYVAKVQDTYQIQVIMICTLDYSLKRNLGDRGTLNRSYAD